MKYLVIFLVAFGITISATMVSYIKENERIKHELHSLRAHLEVQNKAIEAQRVDTQTYNKNAELQEAQANERYKLLNGVSSNCEARMQEAQRILGEFKAFLDKQKSGY